MAFTVSGLSSGIDYGTLIDQLIAVRKQRGVDVLQGKKSSYQSALSAYNTLASKLETMESAADKLRKASTFDVKKGEVDDTTILSASASSTAITGNYTISNISQLAQAHKITNVAAKSLADKDTTVVLQTGQTFRFTVTVDGTAEQTTITATSDLTLEGLAGEINSTVSAANSLLTVSATIINDGSASTPYRLVLTSNYSGSSGGVTINTDESTLDLNNTSGTGGTTTLQSAQDASFTVDGLTITKSSNTVSDVIEGVTFTLKKTDTTNTHTITISNDVDTIKSNIKTMTDSYNDVINHINSNNTYNTEKKKGGPLFNESTVNSVIRRLRSIITTAISGLSADTKVLAQVGVKTNRDGTLTLDESVLSNKLTTDYSDVRALFINDANSGIEGVAEKLYDELYDITDFAGGSVTIRKEGIQAIIDDYDDDIRDEERKLNEYEQSLRIKFAALESLLTTLRTQSNTLLR